MRPITRFNIKNSVFCLQSVSVLRMILGINSDNFSKYD
jgi:hypothetical protein